VRRLGSFFAEEKGTRTSVRNFPKKHRVAAGGAKKAFDCVGKKFVALMNEIYLDLLGEVW